MTPDTEAFCLALAPLVTLAVEALKRLPIVRAHPHAAALVASALLHVLTRLPVLPPLPDAARLLAVCIAATWLASIGVYQVARHTAQGVKRIIGPF